MDNVVEKLKQTKETITSLQNKKARLDGKKEQLLSDLKKKYGVSSVELARKKLEELRTQLDEHEKELKELDTEMDEIVERAESKG